MSPIHLLTQVSSLLILTVYRDRNQAAALLYARNSLIALEDTSVRNPSPPNSVCSSLSRSNRNSRVLPFLDQRRQRDRRAMVPEPYDHASREVDSRRLEWSCGCCSTDDEFCSDAG